MSAAVSVVAVVAVVLSTVALAVVVLDRRVRCRCHREEPLASLTALAAVTAGVRAGSDDRQAAARPTVRHGRHVRHVSHRHRPRAHPLG